MKTRLFIGLSILVILSIATIRFIFGGDEDSWICQDNQWIKHGNPSYQKPDNPCGIKKPLPINNFECLQAGGIWKKQGPEPIETCNIKANDRGTICSDNDECEGWCQANLSKSELREGMMGKIKKGRGQCSVWRVELGCFGMLKQGNVSVICID